MEGDMSEDRETKRPRLNSGLEGGGGELSESDDEGDRKMPAQQTQRPMDTQREILEISDDEGGEAEEVEVLGTRGGGGGAAAMEVPPPSTSSSSSSWSYVPDRRTLPLLPYYLIEVQGLAREANEQTLSIEDAIAGDYTHAVVFNYMWDLAWLLATLPRLKSVPWLCVHGSTFEKQQPTLELHPNISTFRPILKGPFNRGTHHTKLWLLFCPDGVRVVICTANNRPGDWRNKTEGLWVEDFPRLPPGAPDDSSDFGKDLRDYVRGYDAFYDDNTGGASKGHPRLRECALELLRFDFSGARVVLVPSVPGKYYGPDVHKYGHMRLRRALEAEGVDPSFDPPRNPPPQGPRPSYGVVSQFSSWASHKQGNAKWLREEFERTLRAGSHDAGAAAALRVHTVWPTREDVRNSIEGWKAGTSLPCRPVKMFEHKDGSGRVLGWVRERICRFLGRPWARERAMPHLKSFVRYAPGGPNHRMRLAWVLITSHNYSMYPWGQKEVGSGAYTVRSFEMGVLVLPSRFKEPLARPFSLTPDHPILGTRHATTHNNSGSTSTSDSSGSREYKGLYAADMHDAKRVAEGWVACPIPYELPPPPYDLHKDRPWCEFATEDKDVLGCTTYIEDDILKVRDPA